MKRVSKLLLALLFAAIAAIAFVACDSGGKKTTGGYTNPQSSTTLQYYYIQVKDSSRSNALGKDLSTTARLHLKMPMGVGFSIQKVFASDGTGTEVPADANVWYDYTKGNTSTDYEVGNYGGTCFGKIANGLWTVENEKGEIGGAEGTTNYRTTRVGADEVGGDPGGIYAGNLGFAADGKKYFGFVIANSSEALKFNSLYIEFFNGADAMIARGKASEYFGISAGGVVQTNDYTVTFDKNTGDTDAVPATKTITSPPDTTIGALPVPPTKAGNLFKGWNTAANGSGTAFTATTPVTASIPVYAQWQSAGGSVVTFRINGGTQVVDTIWDGALPVTKVVTTSGGTVDALPDAPTKVSHKFIGWNTAADGSGTAFDTTTAVSTDIIVYAQWETSYTDLRNWTIAWLRIPEDAEGAVHIHGHGGPQYLEIQKIFVSETKTLTGAKYIFDSTEDPAYVAGDENPGFTIWWGGLGDADALTPYKIEGEEVVYVTGFGSPFVRDGGGGYLGLIIKTNTQNTAGFHLGFEIQPGPAIWDEDWEFTDLPN